MNSGGLASGIGRGPERAESVMVFGGRPLAVPRYSGIIKCNDLPHLGLKVSILIRPPGLDRLVCRPQDWGRHE